jgi:hypothetical protein
MIDVNLVLDFRNRSSLRPSCRSSGNAPGKISFVCNAKSFAKTGQNSNFICRAGAVTTGEQRRKVGP